MKIGIISDTHDAHRNVLRAIEIFNDRAVEYVFHAGDMVTIVRYFELIIQPS